MLNVRSRVQEIGQQFNRILNEIGNTNQKTGLSLTSENLAVSTVKKHDFILLLRDLSPMHVRSTHNPAILPFERKGPD